ncbi:MAG: class I SAM-dependent methyltransferase [Anaerolineae bacterium]|nr:class I SAM-dependent methyltransferase [Anaerolineae bacterium]
MWYMRLVETNRLPDWLIRAVVRAVLERTLRRQYSVDVEARDAAKAALVEKLRTSPIAIRTQDPNWQHYKVPTEFFQRVLGPWLKYSCCCWPDGVESLAAAEEAMLRLTCQRAGLEDGMDVLDLGCGWGSLTLWIAQHYPRCNVMAVSNSSTQRAYIEGRCTALGIDRVQAVTADVAEFDPGRQFNRVMSIEMFEHMKNYGELMARIAGWLRPEGKLFVHVFSHRELAYEFDADDPNHWMARTFFAGGTMPSDDLLLHFQRDLALVEQWRLDGTHYARTLRAWLDRLDAHSEEVRSIMADVYGAGEATRRLVNWRLFFLVCEEVWGMRGGQEYGVSHYLFGKREEKRWT